MSEAPILDRRAFVCAPTRRLVEHINLDGGGLLRWLEDEVVVVTEELDLERDVEGWAPGIKRAAKRKFLESHVGEDALFPTYQELRHFLGQGDLEEIFDRWFRLRRLELLEIGPEDWKGSH